MKKKLFRVIRRIFCFVGTFDLHIEHKYFDNEKDIPSFDGKLITCVSAANISEDKLRIFSGDMYKDITANDVSLEWLQKFYESIYYYFMSEEKYGDSDEFFANSK